MKLRFVLLQVFFFAYFVQEAKSQGAEDDDCLGGHSCLRRRSCRPNAMKRIIGRPKACGRGKVCCPSDVLPDKNSRAENIQEPENKEICGLERSDQSETVMANSGIPDGKYPWMVALVKGRDRNFCSGFLVDQRHVITAAHCLQTLNDHKEKLFASIGSADYRGGRPYNITRVLIHEGYKTRFFYNDIALLSLSEDVDSSDFNPVCLPPKSLGDLEGRDSRVVGWGDPYTSTLVEKDVQIISGAQCETTFSDTLSNFKAHFPDGITNQLLCTEGLSRGECWYNSGSPLMVKIGESWTAVGISTFGSSCGKKGLPQGYTRVIEYVDWIKDSKDVM